MICHTITGARCVLCVICSCDERTDPVCMRAYTTLRMHIFPVASTYASVGRVSRSPMYYASKCTHGTCLQGKLRPGTPPQVRPYLAWHMSYPPLCFLVDKSLWRQILIIPTDTYSSLLFPSLRRHFETLMQERDNPCRGIISSCLLHSACSWRSFPYKDNKFRIITVCFR